MAYKCEVGQTLVKSRVQPVLLAPTGAYSDSVLLYIQQQQHPLFVLCFLSERTSGLSPVIFSSDRSSYSDSVLLQRPLFEILIISANVFSSMMFFDVL